MRFVSWNATTCFIAFRVKDFTWDKTRIFSQKEAQKKKRQRKANKSSLFEYKWRKVKLDITEQNNISI